MAVKPPTKPIRDGLGAAEALRPFLSDLELRLEAEWQSLIQEGNRLLATGSAVEACRIYSEALALAEHVFDAALRGGSPLLGPMVYNISCANAADAMLKVGDRRAGCRLLLRATDKLLATAEATTSPVALRINCVRHLHYPLGLLDREFTPEMREYVSLELLARADAALSTVDQLVLALLTPGLASDLAPGLVNDSTAPEAARLRAAQLKTLH